jgi:LysM repeat protein
VTVSPHLKEINNLKSDLIKVGQVLELSNAKSYIVASGDTLYSISKKFGVTVEGIKKEN